MHAALWADSHAGDSEALVAVQFAQVGVEGRWLGYPPTALRISLKPMSSRPIANRSSFDRRSSATEDGLPNFQQAVKQWRVGTGLEQLHLMRRSQLSPPRGLPKFIQQALPVFLSVVSHCRRSRSLYKTRLGLANRRGFEISCRLGAGTSVAALLVEAVDAAPQ